MIVLHASWRWVFFVNVPVGVVAVALLVASYRDPPRAPRRAREVWTSLRDNRVVRAGLGGSACAGALLYLCAAYVPLWMTTRCLPRAGLMSRSRPINRRLLLGKRRRPERIAGVQRIYCGIEYLNGRICDEPLAGPWRWNQYRDHRRLHLERFE